PRPLRGGPRVAVRHCDAADGRPPRKSSAARRIIMSHRTSKIGARAWLLAALLIGIPAVRAGAQAIPGDPDHLKCYQVAKDENLPADKIVNLYNKFGLEPGCHVRIKSKLYCTPASKFLPGGNGDDPRGPGLVSDFTCYKVHCPNVPPR